MLVPRRIYSRCRQANAFLIKRNYPGEYSLADDYLWKQLNFLASEFINCSTLMKLERYEEQEEGFFRSILTSSCVVARDMFHPIKSSSETSPYLEGGKVVHTDQHIAALSKYCEMGIPGLGTSFSCAGTQLPLHVAALARVPFACANIGLAGGYSTQTEAVMRLLPNYTNIKNSPTLITDMAQGIAHGAVCLTENHSNSSVSDVRCRAEYDYDDRVYKLKGTKTCVYGAAHGLEGNTFYVVSARLVDAPPGPDGISLFIVPKLIRLHLTLEQAIERDKFFDSNQSPNDITIRRLFDVGGTACTYADIEFGSETTMGASAFMLGKATDGVDGIRQYVTLNNVQVALSAASCALSAYRASLQYAKDPLDFYPSIRAMESYHNTVSDWADGLEKHGAADNITERTDLSKGFINRPDIKRMLLAQKAISEGSLALCSYCMYLDDTICHGQNDVYSRQQLLSLLRLLSPITKAWVTEQCAQSVDMACRVFDGMGVVTDNIANSLLRECKLFTVDGFGNDLHAFDLINNKIPARDAAAYRSLLHSISSCIEQARSVDEGDGILKGYIDSLQEVLNLHEATTARLIERISSNDRDTTHKKNMSELLVHSSEYMSFSGYLVVGWMWLKQGIVAKEKLSSATSNTLSESDRNFYLGKIAALDYFCSVELPKTNYMADVLHASPQVGNVHDIAWHM